MTDKHSALDKIRRARFEAQVIELMAKRHPHEHQMMRAFAQQSDSFVKLRSDVIDHYHFEQRQLSPLFCVDAVAQLVQKVLDNMQAGLQREAA